MKGLGAEGKSTKQPTSPLPGVPASTEREFLAADDLRTLEKADEINCHPVRRSYVAKHIKKRLHSLKALHKSLRGKR